MNSHNNDEYIFEGTHDESVDDMLEGTRRRLQHEWLTGQPSEATENDEGDDTSIPTSGREKDFHLHAYTENIPRMKQEEDWIVINRGEDV